jgi:hypothetical protein
MPPVTNGQFSFNVDTFYVAASGGQIHRRAAPPEIKALYDTGSVDASSAPDHPGHWYEAQLLHYGLPPSKVKATAKMRLLKALQDGKLSVPKEHIQIEKDLKKQFQKQASDEQTQTNAKNTTTKTVTTKTVTVSKTVSSKTIETKASATKAVAKAKPATTKAVAAPKTATKTAVTKAAAAPKAAPKTAAPKAAAPKKATAPKTATPKTATPKPATAKSATPKPAPAKRKRASNDEETSNQPQTAKRRVPAGKKAQVTTNIPPEPSVWPEQPLYEDDPPSYESACGMVSLPPRVRRS